MKYITRTIAEDENILATAHLHWIYNVAALLWLVFGWWLLGYGIYKCVSILIMKATTEICITDRRFIYKRGWLNRQSTEFDISTIEGCNYAQSFLGRIFGFGTLNIRGTGIGDLALPIIAHPVAFRRSIIDAKIAHEREMTGTSA